MITQNKFLKSSMLLLMKADLKSKILKWSQCQILAILRASREMDQRETPSN